jgi:sulfur carrier protein
MKLILRYPKREVEVAGSRRVKELLKEFDVLPETVLVIRGSELLTADTVVGGDDVVELRPVISGGAPAREAARPGGGARPDESARPDRSAR